MLERGILEVYVAFEPSYVANYLSASLWAVPPAQPTETKRNTLFDSNFHLVYFVKGRFVVVWCLVYSFTVCILYVVSKYS